MYSYEIEENGAKCIVEKLGQPVVYFDTWAFDYFSDNVESRNQFVDLMKRSGGTLRISSTNIAELQKRTDQKQLNGIYSLIDSIDSGLFHTFFEEVINGENELARLGRSGNPTFDLTTVNMFLASRNFPDTWSMSELVASIGKDTAMRLEASWEKFSTKVNDSLQKKRNQPGYVESVNAYAASIKARGVQNQTATRELSNLAYAFIIKNQNMSMPGKEWLDLLHTIVPVAYCDYVLIDKRWAAFISETKLNPPVIASVYTKKNITGFLRSLSSYVATKECECT